MGNRQRFKAVVEYDGTEFAGYQRQPEPYRTVQAELEEALKHLTKTETTVWGSGRTDSGVHATGQVIAFDIDWSHPAENLLLAINANLPEDVSIRGIETVAEGFSPRFDAKKRRYEYIIERCANRSRRPLMRYRKWQTYRHLDVNGLQTAAEILIGEHDFSTFGVPPQGNNSVREVYRSEWLTSGDDLIYTIEATAFLYRMVRSIVGSLKQVGEQRWTVAQFEEAFKARDRSRSAGAAPAHGLYLVEVTY